jgi:hypothetical protein
MLLERVQCNLWFWMQGHIVKTGGWYSAAFLHNFESNELKDIAVPMDGTVEVLMVVVV